MTFPYPLTFNFDGRAWIERFDSPNPLNEGFAELVFKARVDEFKPRKAFCTVWADVEAENAVGVWDYDAERGTVVWDEDH